jgi:7,8-dihydropterin-6-yl-methyl-4-(beta-D-ribofuranosyl)aminobenzene 5'-phosphate synthase
LQVKVIILCDNIAGPLFFKGEHGQSMLLDIDGRTFLWDCGLTDVAVHNGRLLGVDFKALQGIGLSHGHMDHAGGLMEVLQASGPKRLHMHPAALEPRYFMASGGKLFAGVPFTRQAIEAACLDLEFSKGPHEVLPGAYMTGEIPRLTPFEGDEPDLFVLRDAELVPDTFEDDQALIVDAPGGAIVLTGCAHSGIVNIMKYALERHGKIRAVIGGTHIGMGGEARLDPTMEFLQEAEVEKMVFSHCTGTVAISRLMDRFPGRMVPGQSGLYLELL